MGDQEAPSPEELFAELRKVKVTDVLLSSMATVAQLGYAKLDAETRDLEQAKVAIESLRALLPVLEGSIPDETARDYRQLVANLQLAYARASGG